MWRVIITMSDSIPAARLCEVYTLEMRVFDVLCQPIVQTAYWSWNSAPWNYFLVLKFKTGLNSAWTERLLIYSFIHIIRLIIPFQFIINQSTYFV